LPEIIENVKALPTASAHARVLINAAKVMSFRGRIVTSTRGLEFIEDESGNIMLNEEGKPTLNAAMSAEKRLLESSAYLHRRRSFAAGRHIG
jgi:hypothetical protein